MDTHMISGLTGKTPLTQVLATTDLPIIEISPARSSVYCMTTAMIQTKALWEGIWPPSRKAQNFGTFTRKALAFPRLQPRESSKPSSALCEPLRAAPTVRATR